MLRDSSGTGQAEEAVARGVGLTLEDGEDPRRGQGPANVSLGEA